MKKIVVLLTAFALLLVGCGTKEQNTADKNEQQFTEEALIGQYADYSYGDTSSVYVSMLTGETAKIGLTVEQGTSGLSFTDQNFKGKCELSENGSVTLFREEIIAENVAQKNMAQMLMEQSPTDDYFMYKDYLIANWTMTIDEIDGELPDGSYTDCSLSPAHLTLTNYTLGFFEDGTCEMESTGLSGDSSEYFEGTYSFDGKIILLTFTAGETDEQSFSGVCKMALYIDEGEVYPSVYKKVS